MTVSSNRKQQLLFRHTVYGAVMQTGTLAKALVKLNLPPDTVLPDDDYFLEGIRNAQKRAWLKELRASESTQKASDLIGTTTVTMLEWAKQDKVFSDEWQYLGDLFEQGHKKRLRDLIPKSIKVKEKILDLALEVGNNDNETLTLANKASDKILSGTRTLDEGPVVEVNNTNNVVTLAELIALAQTKEPNGNG